MGDAFVPLTVIYFLVYGKSILIIIIVIIIIFFFDKTRTERPAMHNGRTGSKFLLSTFFSLLVEYGISAKLLINNNKTGGK